MCQLALADYAQDLRSRCRSRSRFIPGTAAPVPEPDLPRLPGRGPGPTGQLHWRSYPQSSGPDSAPAGAGPGPGKIGAGARAAGKDATLGATMLPLRLSDAGGAAASASPASVVA